MGKQQRFNAQAPVPGEASYDRTSLDVIVVLSAQLMCKVMGGAHRQLHGTLVVDQLGRLRELNVVSEGSDDPQTVSFSDWRLLCAP